MPGWTRGDVRKQSPLDFGRERSRDPCVGSEAGRGSVAALKLLDELERLEDVRRTKEGVRILRPRDTGGQFLYGIRAFEGGLGNLFIGENADFENGKEKDGGKDSTQGATRRGVGRFAMNRVAKPFRERDDKNGDKEYDRKMQEGGGDTGLFGALGYEDEEGVASGDAPGASEGADEADAEAKISFVRFG